MPPWVVSAVIIFATGSETLSSLSWRSCCVLTQFWNSFKPLLKVLLCMTQFWVFFTPLLKVLLCMTQFWVSFKPLLKVLLCTDTVRLLLLTQQAGHKLGGNWKHTQIAFQNTLNWLTQMKYQIQQQLHTVSFFCFWGELPSPITHFHLFCLLIYAPSVQHLQQRSHCFWTWKTNQKLEFFPLSALQKVLSMFQKFL